MDPNQEEDLKKLSLRTEEVLSRLNDLSNSLSFQIKNNQSPPLNSIGIIPPDPKAGLSLEKTQPPNLGLGQFVNNSYESPEANYYALPINTHYLEKSEKSIKTTGSGQQFLSTSSTSIFTEVHNNPDPESFVPLEPRQTEPINVPRQGEPISMPWQGDQTSMPRQAKPVYKSPIEENFQPNISPPIVEKPNYQAQGFYAPTIPTAPPPRPEVQAPSFAPTPPAADQSSLQPSAIFSTGQEPTRRANPQGRTKEIADQIAAHNKEIKDRLQKYSNRMQISSKGDILRLFALAAPFFALGAAIGIVNALEITEFAKISAIYCVGLFVGIFLSAIALRIVEISELTRWAHNQILFIQSTLDEEKNKP